MEDAVEQALPGSEELVAAAEKFDRAVSPLHLVKETRSGAHEYSGEESGPPRDSASRTNRGERPRQSPTQALLGLERERWARVSNGATEHVEIDEKSVQAALHKENMEKFQRTLLQSGAWVRATGSEAEELPVAASREVSEPVNRANSAAIKQAQRAAAPVEAEPANSALLAHQAAAPVNNRKVEPTVPPSASRAASSAAPQPIAQSQSELAGWDDIDERLLWLAKPSS
ncbi:MAG: hypothetical protein FJ145_17480 [Deltaproteobacteria bacterium]|nr:hypothetical protein [Deltaproteobacteria bacterium]